MITAVVLIVVILIVVILAAPGIIDLIVYGDKDED